MPEFMLFSTEIDVACSGSKATGGIPTDVTLTGRANELADGGGTYAGGGSTGAAAINLLPHSSQKRDVSRFAVWHAGHLIIVFIARPSGQPSLIFTIKYFTSYLDVRKS
jgi:hypothetical protein